MAPIAAVQGLVEKARWMTFWDSSIRFDLFISETLSEMKMDRLSEKLNRAAGVVGRVTAGLETRADSVIRREEIIEQRANKLFTAKHAILDEASKGLDGIEQHLALLSNDPLEASGSSPEVEQGTFQQGTIA
jgi:hypothetical protein